MTIEDPDNTPDTESIDTGQPISALLDLEEPAHETFMDLLNRRIQRRLLVADVSRLTWSGPIMIVLEFLKQIFHLGATSPETKRSEP